MRPYETPNMYPISPEMQHPPPPRPEQVYESIPYAIAVNQPSNVTNGVHLYGTVPPQAPGPSMPATQIAYPPPVYTIQRESPVVGTADVLYRYPVPNMYVVPPQEYLHPPPPAMGPGGQPLSSYAGGNVSYARQGEPPYGYPAQTNPSAPYVYYPPPSSAQQSKAVGSSDNSTVGNKTTNAVKSIGTTVGSACKGLVVRVILSYLLNMKGTDS